jgi:transposase
VSGYRVEESFEAHAGAELVELSPEPPRVLSLDESAFKKRFRFHTVFSDPERSAVLDLVEGRGKGAVFGGLLAMSDQVRGGIETVVMDCHWPYRHAVEELLPDARIVVDKFHIIRSVDAAAQRVRMRVGRRRYRQRIGHQGGIARQHNPANNPTVYQARWVVMKRAHKLSEDEWQWLNTVFDASVPELRLAWLLKEQFAAIYEAPDRDEAARRLGALDRSHHRGRAPRIPQHLAPASVVERADPQPLRRPRHELVR